MRMASVGKSAVFYALGIIALRATSMLLIPLYTHFLTMSDFAILTTILITVQLMMYIMPVGTWDSVCKFFTEFQGSGRVAGLFGTSVVVNLTGGILTTGLALTLFLPLLKRYIPSGEIRIYILLACLIALAQSLCTLMMAYYRAQNRAKSYMWIGTASSILLLVSTPVFIILFKMGIKGALYAQVIAYSSVSVLVGLRLMGRYGFRPSFADLRTLTMFGAPLIVSSLATFIIQSSCVYFLGYFGGLEDTAIFTLGFKFSAILAMLIMSPFQLAFAPYFYTHSKDPELKAVLPRIFLHISFISLVLAHAILVFFKVFFPLIAPPAYFASYTVCLLLIPGALFLSVKVIGETILYDVKRTGLTGTVSVIFAVINLFLNALLIPRFTIYGAVASSSATMVLWSVAVFKLGTNRFPFRIDGKKAASILLLLVGLTAGFYLIRGFPVPSFLGFSGILFVVLALAFASDLIFESEDRLLIQRTLSRLVPALRRP